MLSKISPFLVKMVKVFAQSVEMNVSVNIYSEAAEVFEQIGYGNCSEKWQNIKLKKQMVREV